ncbi:MAG TPA: mechanosensitive ion channel family protein [Gemmatimonadales bacterium]|nr:mechanosensitive ion channel family protein [Gemmatimonadales bacterium]
MSGSALAQLQPPAAQTGSGLDRLARILEVDLGLVVTRAAQVAAVLGAAYVAYRLLRLLTRRLERAVDDGDPGTLSEREQRGRTLAQLLNSVGAAAISLGAGLTILNLFMEIGPLLAGVGVVGLAVSFGAQSLVKDVISGFFILLENQFAVGDIIETNGKGGVVERMTLRVVMLRDVQGALHVIPNGSIDVVSNRSRGWSRAVLDIGVAYKENVDTVIRVMRQVAEHFWRDDAWRHLLVEEPAVWGVEALADSSVNIRLVAVTLPGKQWEISRELRRRIKNRFDQEGIEIPFPQRTLHWGDAEQVLRLAPVRSESVAGR